MAERSIEIVINGRDNFSGTANRVIGSLNGINASTKRINRGIGQVAGGLARIGMIAGGAAAAGLVASAKAAISFEDAFAGVRKTADLTEGEFTKLASSFRSMATEIPISANELAKLGEIAGALGIEGVDNIREFSRVTALLGVTTNLTAEAAAESLGHISTILKLTGEDYERFASTLVDLGNKGASTEDQIAAIAERGAGAAATINLSTQALLGWSAAIANMGVEAEAGGTNFQKFLIESAKFTAEAGDEMTTLAKVSGMTGAEWKKQFGSDPNSALTQFVVGLGKLNTEQRILALGTLGWDDQRMARILLGLASNTGNLTSALETSGAAWQDNTALSIEAQKRFDTLASKITTLKNNFVEAAMTIGEGFTPALGRAVEKLTAFMKLDTTKTSLREFGEDVGQALDGINWAEVIDGAKTFVGILKSALDVIMSLPTEIKAAGAAFIGLNTLSGGLIGTGVQNIIGGLTTAASRGIASRIPGIGSVFAQPVYVTNFPPGFGGPGGPGGPGGAIPLGPGKTPPRRNMPGTGGNWLTEIIKNIPLGFATSQAVTAVNDSRNPDTALGQVLADARSRLNISDGPVPVEVKNAEDIRPKTGGRATVNSVAEEAAYFKASLATFMAQTFGTHETASGAFGSAELKQFRGGDMSLLDERIRYLSGAQGSGAGSEQFLAVVGRDIAALKSELPRASAADADRIREGIDILTGILEAKKFVVTPETIAGANDPSRERSEGERAQALMATLPDIRLNPITNVTVNLSWRDIQTRVTTQSRIGPTSGSVGRSLTLQPS